MAEMIPIVEQAAGAASWSDVVTISGQSGAVKFRVSGGTFSDSTTETTISPTTGSDYTVGVKTVINIDESATQPVVVYYEDGDTWVLVHSLSRIFVLPQSKQLDYRLLTKGFDAMPLGSTLNPTYNGLILGGGVRNPTQSELQQSPVVKISDLDNVPFDLTKPVSFVYDRQARTMYFLHTDGPVANTKIFGTIQDLDMAGFKVSYDTAGKRSAILFHESGQVDQLDEAMTSFGPQTQLGYKVNRVVCRRKGVGSNTVDSYVAFDIDGRAHYLNASLVETKVLSDKFYVNGSDCYDILSTATGELVGYEAIADQSNGPTAGTFWHQFPKGNANVLGYTPGANQMRSYRWIYAGEQSRTGLNEDLLFHSIDAAWSNTGIDSAGLLSDGSDALVGTAYVRSGETPVTTRNGWSILSLFNPMYTNEESYDRLYYYAARPVNNLKHLAIRNYQTVWPDLSALDLSPSIKFTITVDASDPDLALPVTAPAGVNVSLVLVTRVQDTDENGEPIETVTRTPVTKVYDGQEIDVTLSHEYITSTSFPVSIGRSVYTFEMKQDDLPDAFHWENILGVENDTWNRTEDVAITGINVSVPVVVKLDGQDAPDRVKIFVDGVEKTQPVFISKNQTLGFEIQHENNTTKVSVSVGSGSSNFGLYTIIEGIIDVGRHWAYMPVGKEVRSDVLKNTGTTNLALTITQTDAKFANGATQITLAPNQTTTILFTPSENKQNVVKFQTDQHSYEWNVWSDDHWLGPVPATKRAERYVLGDSGDILFGSAVPDNFWTYIKVPAGMLLDIDGVRVVLPLDSRGVYSEQDHVMGPFECADTILKIYGLPSHQQPHTLMLGNAPLPWLYDMTVDPTYVLHPAEFVGFIDVGYDGRVAEAITQLQAQTYLGATTEKVFLVDQEVELGDTHVATTTDVTFVAGPVKDKQGFDLFGFDAYGRDYVDGYASFTVVKGQDVIHGTMNLPQLIEGQKDYIELEPLFSFFGTDRGSAADMFGLFESVTGNAEKVTTYPLFESVTGNAEKVTTYPLFESLLGNQFISDDFWPTFFTDTNIRSSEFSNNFVIDLMDSVQAYEMFKPNWIRPQNTVADRTEVRSVVVAGLIHADALTPQKIDSISSFPQPMAEAQKVTPDANFPQPMSEAKLSHWNDAVYHIGASRPQWIPGTYAYLIDAHTARYVDPVYHPAELSPWEIPFVRWHGSDTHYYLKPAPPERMEHPVHYDIDPAPSAFSQFKAVADHVAPQSAEFTASAPIYHVDAGRQTHLQDRPADNVANSASKQISAPKPLPIAAFQSKTRARPVIRVDVVKPKRSKPSVYGIKKPELEIWAVDVDYGETDPLKEGYFATELAALQDATQVWGFDPSMVYGIQQPNGYWTWAQVTICEETCGSMSCSARGYLSGG